ncbi:hypothetical protein EK21DRAFT_61354 [Setomelanomma holmii]|uniref:Lytic polysaccharide monooxygenase n=1 Tax=Setomelanomma holmii TaxID=210430 RepID=A0A9P4HFY6_9PLEO|nr:hypothetical protein EK21DRAFT_61354 [Setomelanomma holmii]
MFSKLTILAATACLAVADAHIKINTPVPFSKDTLDTAPITKSQFPCKSNLGFKVSQMNQMAVGSTQKLAFDGTAVHGGGSCQLSVTTDTEPTENSVFKVIKSIEGGCPGVDGTTNEYQFALPDSIPNGKATFAWTWFSKMSGAPELYMNCAPIEVTGGASDKSAFNSLPDMLVANIGEGCTTAQNFATKFPNPGSVVQEGATNDQKPPTGNCGSSGTTPAQSSSPATQPSSAPQSSAVAQPSAPAGGQSSAVSKPSATPVPSNGGGVFAPGASSAPLPAQTSTTLVTVTAPASAQPTVPSSGTGTPATPSSPSTGGGSAGTCSTNGAVVCNGEKQFGLCNNGNVVWQDVAAGTACVNGVISKRSFNGRVVHPRYRSPRIGTTVGN